LCFLFFLCYLKLSDIFFVNQAKQRQTINKQQQSQDTNETKHNVMSQSDAGDFSLVDWAVCLTD